jgi:hypothetical protein
LYCILICYCCYSTKDESLQTHAFKWKKKAYDNVN